MLPASPGARTEKSARTEKNTKYKKKKMALPLRQYKTSYEIFIKTSDI